MAVLLITEVGLCEDFMNLDLQNTFYKIQYFTYSQHQK